MKSLRILALLAVVTTTAPCLFGADFGLRAGKFNEADDEFVGAELLFDVGSINVNPNIEYSLADDVTVGSVNLDVTFDVFNVGVAVPYVGAGAGINYYDDDFGNETDVVGNLIGGVAFQLDSLTPYAQLKYVKLLDSDEGSDDDYALMVGLRF